MLEKPNNWQELTPEQKRSIRFAAWVSGEAVSFESPAAKAKYQERATLIKDAIELKKGPGTSSDSRIIRCVCPETHGYRSESDYV